MSQYTSTLSKAYDLNIWYPEEWNEKTLETYLDECLSIQLYLWVEDERGSRKFEGDILRLTLEETRAIAPDFPEAEYGSDWWTDVDTFLLQAKALPKRVTDWFATIVPVQEIDIESEPSWWVTKNF